MHLLSLLVSIAEVQSTSPLLVSIAEVESKLKEIYRPKAKPTGDNVFH